MKNRKWTLEHALTAALAGLALASALVAGLVLSDDSAVQAQHTAVKVDDKRVDVGRVVDAIETADKMDEKITLIKPVFIDLATAKSSTSGCSWDRPGVNRYRGTIADAVNRYKDIPVGIRNQLIFRMDSTDYDEIATITRDSIEGESEGGATYENLRSMHFGDNKVCDTVSRAKWKDDQTERGLIYCEDKYCIIVPTVCGNVSRVDRVAPLVMGPPIAGSLVTPVGDGESFGVGTPLYAVMVPVEVPQTFAHGGYGYRGGFFDPPVYVTGGYPPVTVVPPVVTPPTTPPVTPPVVPPTVPPVVPPTEPPVVPPVTPPVTPPVVPPVTPPVYPPVTPEPPVTPPVPEPETYLMMGLGLALIGWTARKRKKEK